MRRLATALLPLIILASIPFTLAAEPSHELEIVSPVAGASIISGTVLEVTVSVSTTLKIRMMTIEGQEMTIPQWITSPPFTFKVGIPRTIVGQKELIAKGITTEGLPVESAPVVVNVVTGGPFTDLNTSPRTLYFNYAGAEQRLSVGIRNNGSMMEVNSLALYTSANPAIAVSSRPGFITACSPGSTELHVQYQGFSVVVPIHVKQTIRGDLNADGHVDERDLAELSRFLGTNATCPDDARDLNHDGKIDEEDVEIMKHLIEEQKEKDKDRDRDSDSKKH